MDRNEAIRKFGRLTEAKTNHAHNAATELEALVLLLPSEKSRQPAQTQVKASDPLAKEFRELGQTVKEGSGPRLECQGCR
jgi:hypothetical protein